MDKTSLGLTRLDPADSLGEDNYSFQSDNPVITNRLLDRALRHHHTGAAGLSDPTTVPVAVQDNTQGTIPAATTVMVAYTLVDEYGGETLPTPATTVSIRDQLDPPDEAPTIALDNAAGGLMIGEYTYAVSLTDGLGGETPLGAYATVSREPGALHAEVVVTGLGAIVTANMGAAGWRLYRDKDGQGFYFLAEGTSAMTTVTDDGTICADCTGTPLDDSQNTTNAQNALKVTVPTTDIGTATSIRVYATTDSFFSTPSLLDTLAPADAGVVRTYLTLELANGAPPDASQSLAQPGKINAETEITNLYWQKPVANSAALPATGNTGGDVRITLDTRAYYVWNGTTWQPAPGGGGGGGYVMADEDAPLTPRATLNFVGAAVTATDDPANDQTVVTISFPDTSWGAPVANEAALPATGNDAGDVRLTLDTGTLYWWDGDSWEVVTGSGGGGGTGADGDSAYEIAVAHGFVGDEAAWLASLHGADGADGSDGAPGTPGSDGADGADGADGLPRVVQNEGVDLPVRAKLDFVGDGVSATDDSANDRTVVTIDAVTGGGGETPLELQGLHIGSASGAVTGNRIMEILRVQGANGKRLRLYGSAAQRDADVARASTTPPTGDHGVMLDVSFTSDDEWLTPPIEFYNRDATWSDQVYFTVNDGTGAASIDITYITSRGTFEESPTVAYPTRDTGVLTTGVLVSGAGESGTVEMATGFRLMRVSADKPSRIRLYTTPAKRDADISRPSGTTPLGDNGVILDATTTDDYLGLDVAPAADGFSMEVVPSVDIAYRVTNTDTTGGTVTVTFTYQRIE